MDFFTELQNLITKHLNQGESREEVTSDLEQALDLIAEEDAKAAAEEPEGEDEEEDK